jgi:hypothetical protein
MLAFQESRAVQIKRDKNGTFGEEIVACHEKHYDELIEKIIQLATRKPN